MAVNILGFIPFGFTVSAWLRKDGGRKRMPVTVLVVLAGAGISLLIELLQVYLPTRDSSLTDFMNNTLGAYIGAWLFRVCSGKTRGTREVDQPALHVQCDGQVHLRACLVMGSLWSGTHAGRVMILASFVAGRERIPQKGAGIFQQDGVQPVVAARENRFRGTIAPPGWSRTLSGIVPRWPSSGREIRRAVRAGRSRVAALMFGMR